MVTSPQQIIRNRMYEVLTSLLHCRFKDIDELRNRIALQYRVYNVNLVEGNGDIVCDNYLIGTVATIDDDIDMQHDIQLFYIKDNLGQYYITEIELLDEVI